MFNCDITLAQCPCAFNSVIKCIYFHTQSALVSELLQLFTIILANGLDYLWTRNMSTRNYGTGELCILHKSTRMATVCPPYSSIQMLQQPPLYSYPTRSFEIRKDLSQANGFQSRIVESAHLAAQQSPPALVTPPQHVLKTITEASAPSSRRLYAH